MKNGICSHNPFSQRIQCQRRLNELVFFFDHHHHHHHNSVNPYVTASCSLSCFGSGSIPVDPKPTPDINSWVVRDEEEEGWDPDMTWFWFCWLLLLLVILELLLVLLLLLLRLELFVVGLFVVLLLLLLALLLPLVFWLLLVLLLLFWFCWFCWFFFLTFLVFGSLLSFFHFIRRFWNQILICLSLKQREWAISILLLRVKYRLKWNSFSNSRIWCRVYAVLCLLGSIPVNPPFTFTEIQKKEKREEKIVSELLCCRIRDNFVSLPNLINILSLIKTNTRTLIHAKLLSFVIQFLPWLTWTFFIHG